MKNAKFVKKMFRNITWAAPDFMVCVCEYIYIYIYIYTYCTLALIHI